MSVKSRVTKLENSLPSGKESLCGREHFDMRVDHLKVGLERFGYRATDEQVTAYAHEFLKARPGFAGLGFDIAKAGLSDSTFRSQLKRTCDCRCT